MCIPSPSTRGRQPRCMRGQTAAAYFVFNGATDLAITKSDSPDPVIGGTDVTYSINVTNGGPSNATSVVVTDNLPPEVSFISCTSTGGGTCGGSGNNRTVSFASLAPGASASITIVANVNAATADGATISNTASVSSNTPDTNPGNNSSTATTSVINQADLAVVKTASASSVETGTNVTYSITVTNKGPNAAVNLTLEDNLPAGTTFVSSSMPSGWACTTPQVGAAGLISCNAVSLASGATATFTVVLNIGCAVSNA